MRIRLIQNKSNDIVIQKLEYLLGTHDSGVWTSLDSMDLQGAFTPKKYLSSQRAQAIKDFDTIVEILKRKIEIIKEFDTDSVNNNIPTVNRIASVGYAGGSHNNVVGIGGPKNAIPNMGANGGTIEGRSR